MVNTWLPVGLKMAEITESLCSILDLSIGEPAGVPTRTSVCHNRTNCPDTVSSRLPLGLNTRRFTGASWAMGTPIGEPSSTRQSCTVPDEAVTTRPLSGLKAARLTKPL
jgi:hypothetical protein